MNGGKRQIISGGSYIHGDLEIELVLEHHKELNNVHKLPGLLDLFLRVCDVFSGDDFER